MSHHLLNTYNPLPIHFERHEGMWLYDANGKRYLDALSGIAVTGLGGNHPVVTQAIQSQAEKIIHTSNLVEIPQQIALADALAKATGAMSANTFFGNSGAEANEAMIKFTRLYGHDKGIENPKVIVMNHAFHGRTLAALSASGNRKIQAGFEPLVQGFVRAEYNDIEALENIAKENPEVVAIFMEPIQGEGGIIVPDSDYLAKVRALCDKHNWLMLLDEIQTGMGRTGKLFAYQHANIVPDGITLAKGLANGIPIGACVIHEKWSSLFKPGSHGSTFGGNPLSCAVGLATLQEIESKQLWENAQKQGEHIINGLRNALSGHPHVKGIRGQGLMMGVELDKPCRDILKLALDKGIIFNITKLIYRNT